MSCVPIFVAKVISILITTGNELSLRKKTKIDQVPQQSHAMYSFMEVNCRHQKLHVCSFYFQR
jgi:hypothetical protein